MRFWIAPLIALSLLGCDEKDSSTKNHHEAPCVSCPPGYVAPVPEPGAFLAFLVGAGVIGFAIRRR